jgi:hypothetical protein
MTTITINKPTKAGKIVLELAKILSVKNKEIAINSNDQDLISEKKARKSEKKKLIAQLSKEVNKNVTKKLLEQYNIHNDSNNG